MNVHRKIIEIDEERCNGCGQCVLDCAEGAIRIVDGKAKVISDHLCDGLGACIGGCPQDALHIVERLAAPFDEEAVHAHLDKSKAERAETEEVKPLACGCPGSLVQHFGAPTALSPLTPLTPGQPQQNAVRGCASSRPSEPTNPTGIVGHWPVKLRLMPESAPLLQGAELLLTADCAPVVYRDFASLAKGKVVLTSCPKFEDVDALTAKVASICRVHALRGITVLRMDVPCCMGLARWVEEAVKRSGQPVSLSQLCLGRDGRLLTST